MKIVKIVGALLVIGLAMVWIQRTLNPKPADEVAMPHAGVGQVLAEQAARAVNDQGRVALVYMESASVESQAQIDSFQRTLGKHKNIKLVATKTFKPMETQTGNISFQKFTEVISEYSNANVIVCCVGVTSLTDAQLEALKKSSPKLVVMNWNRGHVERGMNAGLVLAAVSSRWLTSLPTDHPKTPLQWFDRYYDLVTPQRN